MNQLALFKSGKRNNWYCIKRVPDSSAGIRRLATIISNQILKQTPSISSVSPNLFKEIALSLINFTAVDKDSANFIKLLSSYNLKLKLEIPKERLI